MRRDIFTADHEAFRDVVRSFIKRDVEPHHEQWERAGVVAREVWLAAGRTGLLGIDIDEKYGGGGNADYRYYLILNEELARAGAHGPGFQVHNDIVGRYRSRLGTQEQRERWLPGYCTGSRSRRSRSPSRGPTAICGGCVPSPHWSGTTTWSTGRRRSSPTANCAT